jgi:hypothetical protein
MKHIALCIIISFLFGNLAAIDVSGIQSGTWDPADNPHNLVGDVTVPSGSELSIMPGVILHAMGNFRINAEGRIQAIGTETDSIYFLNAQDPPSNMWKGIRLENETQQSDFKHVVVEYAEYGINAVDSPLEVSYCRFSYNQRGLHLYGIGNLDPAPMNVHHNLIEYTVQNGILIPQNSNAWVHHNELRFNGTGTQYYGTIQLANQSTGGQNNPIIEHNHIHHNQKQGITAWDVVGASAINPTIRYNHIEANLTGIYLLNASGIVHNNTIINNFIPGDANSGAGMMISGATSLPYVAENILTGNFTGFYITTNAMPVLGDLTENHPWAHGMNVIQNNVDGSGILHSVVCASYSQSENVIKAENNDWGAYSADVIEVGITDHNDAGNLPLVDFEPWWQEQESTNITGAYQRDTQDYPALDPHELQLLLVDIQSGEIVESHILQTNPFSIESEIDVEFFALITAVDPQREIWAAAGGLDDPASYDPTAGEEIELDDIYIDAWQHYEVEITGEPELIEDHEVFPISHGFLVFNIDTVDYFYDEGDSRYIYRHLYRDETGWHEVNFGLGQHYQRLANIEHDDTWTQNYVHNGLPIQNTVQCKIDDDGRYTYVTMSSEGNILRQQFSDDEYQRTYLFDEAGFAERYLELEQAEQGVSRYYHRANSTEPHELRIHSDDLGEQAFDIYLWWQAPAFSGVEYESYQIFMQALGGPVELLYTIPLGQASCLLQGMTGSGLVDFWVRATDGTNDSQPSNTVTVNFPVSNQDLLQQPELMIYPNPVNFRKGTALRLESKNLVNPKLKVYNIRGQQVFSTLLTGDNYEWRGLDSRGQAVGSGIYMLRLESADQPAFSRKIMVLK